MNDNIGIVFMHGAGLGSFIWNDLKPLIKYPVLTIDFPNREAGEKSNYNLNFNDYTKSAIDQIERWNKEKIILVTHSIGGCVGLKVAEYLGTNLVGFVGISSAIPISGNSFISCLPFPQNLLMPLIIKFSGTKPPKKSIEQELCNDLTSGQTSKVVNRFTPEAKALYTAKVNYKKPDTKTLYIKLNNDKGFPIQLQDKMIKNLNAQKIITLDSGHLPMLSKPNQLSEILNDFLKDIN